MTCMKFVLQIMLLNVGLICLGGCAPSIRYTRAEDGQVHYMVPKNWDYRKYYKVPTDKLVKVINSYIGVPYRYAGMSRKGVDCSGLVCLVFKEVNHAKLPRSSKKMSRCGRGVSINQAQAGDLVFFTGGLFGSINHVGIYIGNKKFVHASTKKGVVYSSLDEPYFQERFAQIRRVF